MEGGRQHTGGHEWRRCNENQQEVCDREMFSLRCADPSGRAEGGVGSGQSAPAPGVMSLEVLGGGGAFG